MKKLLLLVALFIGLGLSVQAQDYSGLIKTATLTNAQTDSTVVTIPKGRSAVTFKYDIVKTSGTIAGTIVLQTKVTSLAGEQRWQTVNTFTITDGATDGGYVSLALNPGLRYKVLTVTSGTSVSVHKYYLLYRQ